MWLHIIPQSWQKSVLCALKHGCYVCTCMEPPEMAQSVRIQSKTHGFKAGFKPLATLPVTSEQKRLLAPKLHINYNSFPDQQPLMREGEITNAGQGAALTIVTPAGNRSFLLSPFLVQGKGKMKTYWLLGNKNYSVQNDSLVCHWNPAISKKKKMESSQGSVQQVRSWTPGWKLNTWLGGETWLGEPP